MIKAVRFDHFGDVNVLNIVEVEKPSPSPGRVLVRVVTAGTNPGEISIREGKLEDKFPTTFPCGEGTDFAGIVAKLGEGVTSPAIGTAVLGWSNERSAQAEFVSVPAEQVIVKPESLNWEVAGALFVVAATAKAAVAAVAPQRGETMFTPMAVLRLSRRRLFWLRSPNWLQTVSCRFRWQPCTTSKMSAKPTRS